MDSHKLKFLFFLLLSTFVAIYLGIAAATAQTELFLWIAGSSILLVCVLLGKRIWLLIPLVTGLSITLPLPGGLSTLFFTQMLVMGFWVLLFLMRKLDFEIRITELEICCMLVMVSVAQVYMRNPVGLNVLGTTTVGGRDYVVLGMSFLFAAMLSTMRVKPEEIIWYVRLLLIGSLCNFVLGVVAKFVPGAGLLLAASFSTDFEEAGANEEVATRVSFVRQISSTIALWVSSKISPLRASFHPVFAPLILLSLGLAAYSGFRSQLVYVGMLYIVGTLYQGGLPSFLISSLLGVLFIALLAFINLVSPLHPNIQRTLTFLPGTWEEQYRTDAEGSTQWRVEMWKEALFTDKWIQNKWFGDGLGMTSGELAAIIAINEGGRRENSTAGGLTSGQVNMMLSGGYHSGPVQTVRMVGYAGLAALLFGFIRMMVHAHRQIKRARGTEWYYPTLFICLPIIVDPISWVLVIGSFSGGAALLLTGCAMLRILERNLPLPAYVIPERLPYMLKNHHAKSSTPQPGRV